MNTLYILLLIQILGVASLQVRASSKDAWDACRKDWSPLMHAVYKSSLTRAERLIGSGANVMYESESGLTVLDVAIRVQSYNAVDLVLGAGKFQVDSSNRPVIVACQYQNTSIVRRLVAAGYSIEGTDEGWTPLMAASSFGPAETVHYLISLGADVNKLTDRSRQSALMCAVQAWKIDNVEALSMTGARPEQLDANGNSVCDHISSMESVKPRIEVSRMKVLLQCEEP